LKAAELSAAERKASVPSLLKKFAENRPKLVIFVGLSIACDVFGFKKVDPGILSYKMVHGHGDAGMMSFLCSFPHCFEIFRYVSQ
jgi:hypothetical protein